MDETAKTMAKIRRTLAAGMKIVDELNTGGVDSETGSALFFKAIAKCDVLSRIQRRETDVGSEAQIAADAASAKPHAAAVAARDNNAALYVAHLYAEGARLGREAREANRQARPWL